MTIIRGVGKRVPPGDYVSPGFATVLLDAAFPHMIIGDPRAVQWPYLRREIPHNWYVDARHPRCGFLSRDEAHVLFNNALAFRGQRALEIGCWKGWSTCHLLASGVDLDVIDPVLRLEEFRRDVAEAADLVRGELGVAATLTFWPGESPEAVDRLGLETGARWPFMFIDGNHDAPSPRRDAMSCDRYATDDALILLHDLVCPAVADALVYLRERGWSTALYHTMQIMGVAWRGQARPVPHQPDPSVRWMLPEHLRAFPLVDVARAGQVE